MSAYKTWEELTLAEQLQCTWSDYHKDVHGFRPRFATEEQWNDAVWLQAQIDELTAHLDRMKQTKDGRNRMRDDGWVVNAPATAEQDGWVDYMEAERLAWESEMALQAAADELEASIKWPGKDYEYLEAV